MAYLINSLNKGLILHLPLDQRHKQGSLYADLSAQGNPGTPVNAPTATTDRFGRENMALLFFAGTRIDLSSTNFISKVSSDIAGSASAWINHSAAFSRIFGVSKGDSFEHYLMIDVDGNHKLRVVVTSATGDVVAIYSNSALTPGTWYHFVVSQDGSTLKMYVNGVLQTSTGGGKWLSALVGLAYARVAGIRTNNIDSNFYGSLHDFRYYSNRALSAGEVQALYRLSGTGNLTLRG